MSQLKLALQFVSRGQIKPVWQASLLLVLVVAAYSPALNGGFIWDDDAYVTNNPLLTAPEGLRRIWFTTDSPSQYFPLTYSVFRLEYSLWGLNPTGYHWVNVLLHAVNALLVWRLLKQLAVPGAFLAGALFALHPVQVESVAWITELKNVLSLFFFLLTLRCWIEFIKPAATWRCYGLALALYPLSLFSKTTACTLPAALLLILWLKTQPISWRRLLQVVPFLAMGVGMGLLTMWWERNHQGTQGKLFSLNLPERLLVASHGLWFYAGKLFWPVNLTFSYPHWQLDPARLAAYLWLALLFVLGGVILFARRWSGRSLEVAVGFYVAMLSPLLGFIMLYTFRYTFVADHYQYVASIGLIAFTAAAITCAFKSRPHFLLPLGGALLLTLGLLTWRQAGMYTDLETLWRTTLARNPDSWMAHNNLGLWLKNQGRPGEAVEQYQQALALNPDSYETLNNLGRALTEQGRLDEATAKLQQALQLNPNYVDALSNLGNALSSKGRFGEAIQCNFRALQMAPGYPGVLNNLAWLLATCPDDKYRNGAVAVRLGERACELTSNNEPVFLGTLAAAYAEAGRYTEAVATAEQAEQLANDRGLTSVAARNQQLIELYLAGKPFHETPRAPKP